MNAIEVRGLGKEYLLGERSSYKRFTDIFSNPLKHHPRKLIHALSDVSFDIESGETVGVIGRNGAGKSTLLKILSRITSPTSGCAEIDGRVGSLLEVGTGFHPELTGRENIYFNGALLGMKRREIADRFDDIVKFSELDLFIDTPVKRYSSGMYVRLAFAVAAHMDTEILLVDEVLAVGDVAFQKKCMRKMGDVAESGRTILFVSHDMSSIRNICGRVLWIRGGRIEADGDPMEVTTKYLNDSLRSNGAQDLASTIENLPNDPAIKITNITISQNNTPSTIIMSGDPVEVEIRYVVKQKTAGLMVFVDVIDERGVVVIRSYCGGTGGVVFSGFYISTLTIPPHLFAHRDYEFNIGALIFNTRTCTGHTHDGVHIPVHVEMSDPVGYEGALQYRPLIEPRLKWETK